MKRVVFPALSSARILRRRENSCLWVGWVCAHRARKPPLLRTGLRTYAVDWYETIVGHPSGQGYDDYNELVPRPSLARKASWNVSSAEASSALCPQKQFLYSSESS